MNLKTEIENISRQLEMMNDEQLIEAIKKIMAFARTKSYEADLKPMSRDELIKRALQSNDDIANGRTEDVEAVRNQSKQW